MSVVVAFLSMLGQEAETGGVHRMLGVCSEFERIAKVVIEKAEKENSSRRKRKSHETSAAKTAAATATPATSSLTPPAATTQTPRPQSANANTPRPPQQKTGVPSGPNGQSSPGLQNGEGNMHLLNGFSPMTTASTTISQTPSPPMAPPAGWPSEFTSLNGADCVDYGNFTDATGFSTMAEGHPGLLQSSPSANGAVPFFQQPLLPVDIYNLPHALDWDWAEMSGGAYPSVENGNFGDEQ
jgi:hypothetical protein